MIPAAYDEELLEAIPRLLLAPGEQLIAVSATYSPIFNPEVVLGKVVQTYKGTTDLDLALTNINLRWFNWKTVKVKTGFLQYGRLAIPELATEGSVPLSRITTAKSSQDNLRRDIARDFRKRHGRDVGVCTFLEVNWEGGFLSQFSPYEDFPVLIKNLDLARSGAALSSSTHTMADAVERLSLLKGEGVLTDEEFERAKAGFVGSTVEVVESSASILRQLYALKQSGVLTDSEFSMKKWDVLSQPR